MTDSLAYLVTAAQGAATTATTNFTAVNLPNAGTPDMGFYYRALVTAVSGTTPTMGLQLQVSRDGGTTWLGYGIFRNQLQITSDTITAPGEYYAKMDNFTILNTGLVIPMLIRVVATIGGTTPSFSFEVAQVLGIPG